MESRSSGGGGSRPLHRGEEKRKRSKKKPSGEKVLGLCVEGVERERWWQTKRNAFRAGNERKREESRDTITSCTRRAPSHFQTLLHEARSLLSSTSGRIKYFFMSEASFRQGTRYSSSLTGHALGFHICCLHLEYQKLRRGMSILLSRT